MMKGRIDVQVKGNLQLMKEINTAMILNLLHREGKLTRAELKKITKLSATTVSALIEELIEQNYVEEVGEKISEGAGRRAISLQINREGGYVIGISCGNHDLTCAVMNFHGECIAEFTTRIAMGNELVAEQIREALHNCLKQVDSLKLELIKGIGVSTPGIIDAEGEVVLVSRYLQLSNFNLKRHIAEAFPHIPIRIMNDSNAAAFAEFYSGSAKDKRNVIYFTVNEGIGSSLILHSQIYAGARGAAGEIGHIPADPEGEICTCGARGCIETVLTSPFILRKCIRLAEECRVPAPVTFEEVIARYEAGEVWLLPVFDKIRFVTTLMLASAANFVDPEVIIIEGWMNESPTFMAKLREALEGFPFPTPFDGERILPAFYGDKGSLYGAATLMLQQLFSASVLK